MCASPVGQGLHVHRIDPQNSIAMLDGALEFALELKQAAQRSVIRRSLGNRGWRFRERASHWDCQAEKRNARYFHELLFTPGAKEGPQKDGVDTGHS